MSQPLKQQQQQQAASASGTAAAGVSLAGIRDAAERTSSHLHVTPVLTCEAMDEMSGGKRAFFKCELFQKTGSFKARGACNAVLLAPPDCQNVVTHSSGNHAQDMLPHGAVDACVRCGKGEALRQSCPLTACQRPAVPTYTRYC